MPDQSKAYQCLTSSKCSFKGTSSHQLYGISLYCQLAYNPNPHLVPTPPPKLLVMPTLFPCKDKSKIEPVSMSSPLMPIDTSCMSQGPLPQCGGGGGGGGLRSPLIVPNYTLNYRALRFCSHKWSDPRIVRPRVTGLTASLVSLWQIGPPKRME